MLGCLDACRFVCLVADLERFRVAFWRPLVTYGICCKALVPFGLSLGTPGFQVGYLAFPSGGSACLRARGWDLVYLEAESLAP